MESNINARTGQKGLAFLASSTAGSCTHCQSANAARPRLPKYAVGVGVTVAALEFAEVYSKGITAEEILKEALLQAAQIFSAMNASRVLARQLASWNIAKGWSNSTVTKVCLLTVLAAYDLRLYVVKRGLPDQAEQDRCDHQKELKHSLASSVALFGLMLWPTGEAIVRASVGWSMLRTACATTARLLFGDKGYSKFSSLLAEIEGSINGFLVIVYFPLICVWTALVGVGSSVGRGAARVAIGLKNVAASALSGVASVFSR